MNKHQSWPKVTVRDVCELIQYGYTASATKSNIGPKYLRITDIVPEQIDWDTVPYCEIRHDQISKYQVRTGDIVIARTGATCGYAKRIKAVPSCVFASYLVRLRVKSDVDNLFVGMIIESSGYKNYIAAQNSGAAQPNANAQVLTSYSFDLPPVPIQRKIAAIISVYDDLIENNTRRIKILEEIAQSIYREWFVNFRFPGHEKIRMVDSKLGQIPEGWEIVKLGDVIELAYGKALNAGNRNEGPVPVYGSAGVVGYHDESYVKGPGIIVGRKGNVGKVFWSDCDFYPIDTVFYVKTSLNLSYVFYNLRDQNFLNSDAAVPGLNRNQAYLNMMLKPDHQILNSFDSVIIPIFDLIVNIETKNSNLRNTRDLLLPRLMSGELDVSELDISIDIVTAGGS